MTKEEALRYLQAVSLMLLSADNKPIADFYEALNIAIEVLEQEPKTGHWITEHPLDYFQPDEYKCSECGRYYHKKVNECPNCFAKMVEPQESEDA